ncbi:MAG: hypothetical protein AAF492_18430 [Verrucomicrobiota bacterium]
MVLFGFIGFLVAFVGVSTRAGEVEVVDVQLDDNQTSDDLVKLTWEVELENTSDEAKTVTVTLTLQDASGGEVKSFTIEDVEIPAMSSTTEVQSRPIAASDWDMVNDHDVSVEE